MNDQLNSAGAQINSVLSSFGRSMAPLGRDIGKQWVQVQQFAKERMNGGVDATELPSEYRLLEEKVDKVKMLYESFLKVSRNYTLPAYDYEPALNDKVLDFANTFSSNATSLAGQLSGGQLGAAPGARQTPQPETPTSLSHAFAKAAYQGAELVHPEEPLAAALKKFGAAEERAGNMRIKQDQDATAKFHNPLMQKMNLKMAEAIKSRRNVQSVRLIYDACRARLKTAAPEKAEALRTEMEKAEDEFVIAVDDSMGKMKLVVENSDLLRSLADLVAIQLQYHKSVYEVLAEVSPEIDELVVTNEAIYTAAAQH
ncbi:hypothetical protein BATDEDRAFT_35140 [Batrachochytrium dendrobatidis JAM81]|uniref:BAR domain-containing protein n=2 Tax=Batrachochytrium dendrobatidis TaxID=109871 RepID=F4P2Q4_BATDJ|nr:uncharacterized protein BATDEDRAFT_35140 [Batrachochytrium dendrobatidis JAM81]EGF80502.1 hypothetical protein BATDEDRAFT_35140 [Batrachochytrium dendrobatidis JAM81]KAJ8326308.1 BAR domain-containing protein [Batrachochytrium dendrobatidis]KAK5670094.1 BAR domain-containing protein [Batrachochytrium dendrobatidis]OAJ40944.1 hypothetical protein BDEG_24618 [Batrachochytrium dendrobatidis JEL423]|eukprot:XP_006679119.1 hypothetical protein BATDEDRAFT_35140 [Batrachochytrium dendrobatidis JAM81]